MEQHAGPHPLHPDLPPPRLDLHDSSTRGHNSRAEVEFFFVMVLWQVVEERMAAFQTLLDALVEMQRSSTVVQRLLNQFLLNTSNE